MYFANGITTLSVLSYVSFFFSFFYVDVCQYLAHKICAHMRFYLSLYKIYFDMVNFSMYG